MSSVSSNVPEENPRDLKQGEEPRDDENKFPIVNDDREEFPKKSIRVLLVDSYNQSSLLMEKLLKQLSYQVTTFRHGDYAIDFLMKNKDKIDLVIWDLKLMPSNYGLEAFINTIDQEIDLPVVSEHKKETVMNSFEYGACDFLLKPVSKEVIEILWKHVYRKRMSKSGYDPQDLDQSDELGSKNVVQDTGEQNKKRWRTNHSVWTDELHHAFVKAIAKKAVPSSILNCLKEDMNIQGLNYDHVKSHLQKHRQSLEKNSGVPNETRQDSIRRNAGPSTSLTASTPLLNSRFTGVPYDQAAANAHVTRQDYGWLGSSFNLHTREPYFTNDQATARALIQYPSTIYLAMTNSLANLPYTDSFHQPLLQQQQQYDQSYLQLPSVTPTQDSSHVSSAMENQNLIDLNKPAPDNLDPSA